MNFLIQKKLICNNATWSKFEVPWQDPPHTPSIINEPKSKVYHEPKVFSTETLSMSKPQFKFYILCFSLSSSMMMMMTMI